MSEAIGANTSGEIHFQSAEISALLHAGEPLPQNSDPLSGIPAGVRHYLPEHSASGWLTLVRDQARSRWHDLRRRTRYWQHEYPAQTIWAMAGMAFAVGMMLRVWRSASD